MSGSTTASPSALAPAPVPAPIPAPPAGPAPGVPRPSGGIHGPADPRVGADLLTAGGWRTADLQVTAAGDRPHRALVVDAAPPPSPGAAFAGLLVDRACAVDLLAGTGGASPAGAFDLVVGLTPADGDARWPAWIARQRRARLVVVLQGLGEVTGEDHGHALRQADRVTVPCDSFRHPLHAHGVDDDRIVLLPPWVQAAPPSFDRVDARRRLGWPVRAFLAVHAGPVDPVHRLGQLADAARRLGPDSLIVVPGGRPGDLPAAGPGGGGSGGRILVTPALDDEARELALVAADALVIDEPPGAGRLGLPAELARCLSAGRPVVATAPLAGTVAAELARADGAGLVVPPGEPARLAGALLALHADPSRRVAMGLAAIAHSDARLSPGAVLARFDRIVGAVLAGPPPAHAD